MLKAVFFDVGNTLLAPHPSVAAVVREVLADEGHLHDLSAIDAYLPIVDQYYEDRYRTDDTFWTNEEETSAVWVGMYTLLLSRLGIEASAERLARRVYDEFGHPSRWRFFEDVPPALTRLRERGLRIGLISNWDRRLSRIVEGLGASHLIDDVVASAEVGLHKPDPRIFLLACERLGVEPSQAAHVGDHHYADILGATSVGMTAVLIDRSGERIGRKGARIRTLDELDGVLWPDQEGA